MFWVFRGTLLVAPLTSPPSGGSLRPRGQVLRDWEEHRLPPEALTMTQVVPEPHVVRAIRAEAERIGSTHRMVAIQ